MATETRTFELRTYVATPGKLDALQARFRDHTIGLFKRHGLGLEGFWVAVDADDQPTETLVYLLSFDSRAAAKTAWAAFQADPEWVEARAASEVAAGGPLTVTIQSLYLTPNDYSPLI